MSQPGKHNVNCTLKAVSISTTDLLNSRPMALRYDMLQVVSEVKAKKMETMKGIKRLQGQKESLAKKQKMAKAEYEKVSCVSLTSILAPYWPHTGTDGTDGTRVLL